MDLMESDLYRRLLRWLIGLMACAFLCLFSFGMLGWRFATTPWEFHISRYNAGKIKGTAVLSDRVVLYRTRSSVGIHLKDGPPLVAGVVTAIDYEAGNMDHVIVAYRSDPALPLRKDQVSVNNLARVNLITAEVTQIEDRDGFKESTLQSIAKFFP